MMAFGNLVSLLPVKVALVLGHLPRNLATLPLSFQPWGKKNHAHGMIQQVMPVFFFPHTQIIYAFLFTVT